MTASTEVVLFDLGGVLIELAGTPLLGRLVGEEREEEVWRRWLSCPLVRRYERGHCSTAEFAAGMVADWELPMTPEEFLRSFLAWPRGLYPEARQLLDELAGRVRRACFSNTNELHWTRQRDAAVLREIFDASFASHEIGLVKPDREAFEHVVEALATPPEAILFIDDNQVNVDGARVVGIDAHRALGVEGARRVLVDRGIL